MKVFNYMTPWKHGAELLTDTITRFRLWAPLYSEAQVLLPEQENRSVPLHKVDGGYFQADVDNCPAGTRYLLQVEDHTPYPDPASRFQPEGVHEASAVVDARFAWGDDQWAGIPLNEYIIYELHVGTFTPGGTFESAIAELPRLKDLGITAIEIMPIAQFPGSRNWGYDGVYMYAAQYSYGGLAGFQKLVNAAHLAGLAVVLDVVYNHLGPEGNYLSTFGPYFTSRYQTPWGASINYDGPYSDGVRDFFIGNALFWMEVCHVDALRLDAIHAIIDTSAMPFLNQLTSAVHEAGRRMHKRIHVFGEDDRNDPKFGTVRELGGTGGDGQWSDDFHHALHSVLTGEQSGYYQGFGQVSKLAKAFTDGFVYDGQFSPYRQMHHGADSREMDGIRFVVCSQNHDQVGNRMMGERLSMLVDFRLVKLAAISTLMSPYIPLLFMGEETASQSPFQYFVSHGDPALVEAVRKGRAGEFKDFFSSGAGPDPQSEQTYLQSHLKQQDGPEGLAVLALYKQLIAMRKSVKALGPMNKRITTALASDVRLTLAVVRGDETQPALVLFNFADVAQSISAGTEPGLWDVLLDSESAQYGGRGDAKYPATISSAGELTVDMPPYSALVLLKNTETAVAPLSL